MMDLGDIREGYVDEEELIAAAVETEKLSHVDLYGIGTNLTCFSFIQADEEKWNALQKCGGKWRMPPAIHWKSSAAETARPWIS